MLSSRFLKWGLIKEKNNKYLIDKEIIETKDTNVISKYFLENIYKNYLPFKKMIDFLISFDKKNKYPTIIVSLRSLQWKRGFWWNLLCK